jgi:hypothetical protein
MNRSFMTILVLLATACPGSGSGETDGFGSETTDGITGGAANTGPSTEGMSSTMTAGMTDAMSSTMTAGMTEGMTATEGDDMNTTGAADSTGTTPSLCLASGEYFLTLVEAEDPNGHFPFLQLFYSALMPDDFVDEAIVIDVADDGTVTIDILPRDSDGASHEGASGLAGTITPECEVEIAGQAAWESGQGSFGTIDIDISGSFTDPADAPPTADVTLSGGSIPNGPITYGTEIVPQ